MTKQNMPLAGYTPKAEGTADALEVANIFNNLSISHNEECIGYLSFELIQGHMRVP
jgi:hypothetical protein